MLPQSHVIIAHKIHEHIYSFYGINLNKEHLIYGSVKPDIYSGFPKLKHFKDQSLGIISDKISDLARQGRSNADLAKELGVVAHYVADYFCHPHNDRATYKNHLIKHLLYEKSLHKEFKSAKAKKFNLERQEIAELDFKSREQVVNYINCAHKSYARQKLSYQSDMINALRASLSVAILTLKPAA